MYSIASHDDYSEKDPSEMVFKAGNSEDLADIRSIFNTYKSMSHYVLAREGDVKLSDRAKAYAFALFHWVKSSNRCHLAHIHKSKRIASMSTDYQFVMLSAPVRKEQEFTRLKEEHGTFFAFHGSGGENWHSILRNGLYNASGTKYQVNGAAHGSGVYLSPYVDTSSSYARMSHVPGSQGANAKECTLGTLPDANMRCMAICEVIDTPAVRKSHPQIWVVPNENHVCTRFLFVYDTRKGSFPSGITTTNPAFKAKLEELIKVS